MTNKSLLYYDNTFGIFRLIVTLDKQIGITLFNMIVIYLYPLTNLTNATTIIGQFSRYLSFTGDFSYTTDNLLGKHSFMEYPQETGSLELYQTLYCSGTKITSSVYQAPSPPSDPCPLPHAPMPNSVWPALGLPPNHPKQFQIQNFSFLIPNEYKYQDKPST